MGMRSRLMIQFFKRKETEDPFSIHPVSTHDVSGELRDDKGRWTSNGMASSARAPRGVAEVLTSQIMADPKRFQFKMDTDQDTGAGQELKQVSKFDHDLAGVLLVWQDPDNGKTYVVNGHHRLDLAKRMRVRRMVVRYVDAPNAEKAMIKGAIVNIAEGRGTPLDAAKLFRTTHMTRKQLDDAGVSVCGTMANTALGLSNLCDPLWHHVVHGGIPSERGSIIGDAFQKEAEQMGLYNLLQRREKGGRRLTNEAVKELSHFVDSAGRRTSTITSLFGDEMIEKSLAVEKAEICASVKGELLKDKRVHEYVTSQDRVKRLATANTTVDVDANRQKAHEAAAIEQLWETIYDKTGPLAKPLNDAARRLAEEGKGAKSKIVKGLIPVIIDTVMSEYGNMIKPKAAVQDDSGTGDLFKSGINYSIFLRNMLKRGLINGRNAQFMLKEEV